MDEYSKEIFPLVSVIVPTFNRPEFFEMSIGSALVQTYRNIEVVVSDNSTNDDTENLMQKYIVKYPNVKYFHHQNFSADDNWNWARHYDNPDAEYVNWLMDDDLFYPEKIELMVEVYRNNPDVSLVASNRDFIDEKNNPKFNPKNFFKSTGKMNSSKAGRQLFLSDNYIGEPTTVLIRKKFLRNNDLCWFDDEQGFYPLVDVSTWLQLLTQGNLFWINKSLSLLRNHLEQQTFFKGTGLAMVMCWARFLKNALDKKLFFRDEKDIREAFAHWFDIIALKLREAQYYNYSGEEVSIAEDFYIAMAKAFRNGYDVDLPQIKYSGTDKFKKIIETR